MIQIIVKNKNNYKDFPKKEYYISEFSDFQSFDNYEITVIDISDPYLWYNKNDNLRNINQYLDLKSLKLAIQKSNKTNILIIFPQNISYKYHYYYLQGGGQDYTKNKKLKDMIEDYIFIINNFLFDLGSTTINYGKTRTKIDQCLYTADFSFSNIDKNEIIKKAENSYDTTIIKKEKAYITTVSLKNEEEILNLLKFIFPSNFTQETMQPTWMKDINFYNDIACKDEVDKINKNIETLKEKRNEIEQILIKNSKYKSILYESGEILSQQINKMFSEIFEYDISQFKDTFEEDCLIKLDDVTFVIETKGLNNEISGHNISDACNHLIIYEDKLEEENKTENAKCLFIVAYERKKSIQERVKIKERVEKIAKANNTLIVDTRIFLNIFEDFLNNKIRKDEIKEIFKNNIGVLEYTGK